MQEFSHIPVMLEECMENLALKDGGIYFDGTVGGGGHSYEILKRTSPSGRLIATDLDDEALAAAKERLSPFNGRFSLYKANYKDYARVLQAEGVEKLDGAILDYGVSSHQIDDEKRGFSYRAKEAPLDMRMDVSASLTAETVVNTYSEERLYKIIREYGEEKFAKQIAANVVKTRAVKPLKTCGELAQVIENSIPLKFRFGAPCERKTFQAIRIEVNGELDGLYELVIGLTRRLKTGGRIAILTFHSLEDRAVKEAFKFMETPCTCPKNLPVCVCGKKQEIKIITKKPVTAGEEEVKYNSRSKCAKLRVAERIAE
ncbi:MAG: 16S rRNA (cytosine(1402)-N(4))-methyltransferase RsmH [Candidatus Borkfalkiaceae bacterium]|nr:16S rRNA (cytosine(1402)-N(4))-methyltransferase RsmH [Clostridia bacterium]MDY6223413.1 16S rRNA (cytosine(1402)-N(4))-methyltransferase RsmH [Christensenellaceae bacterium]